VISSNFKPFDFQGCLHLSLLLGVTIWLLAKNVISKFKLENEINAKIQHAIITSQEAEREALANNLHDDFGPQLSILYRQLQNDVDPGSAITLSAQERQEIYSKLNGLIADIRKYSTEIYPTHLQKLGLIASLQANMQAIQGDVETDFFDGTSRPLSFDLAQELTVYRIASEILHNILKHAKATRLSCQLTTTDTKFEILFCHNGKPFVQSDFLAQAQSGSGKGCSSILNRTLQLNGTISYFVKEELVCVKLVTG